MQVKSGSVKTCLMAILLIASSSVASAQPRLLKRQLILNAPMRTILSKTIPCCQMMNSSGPLIRESPRKPYVIAILIGVGLMLFGALAVGIIGSDDELTPAGRRRAQAIGSAVIGFGLTVTIIASVKLGRL